MATRAQVEAAAKAMALWGWPVEDESDLSHVGWVLAAAEATASVDTPRIEAAAKALRDANLGDLGELDDWSTNERVRALWARHVVVVIEALAAYDATSLPPES